VRISRPLNLIRYFSQAFFEDLNTSFRLQEHVTGGLLRIGKSITLRTSRLWGTMLYGRDRVGLGP